MQSLKSPSEKAEELARLRRELLRRIVANEARRQAVRGPVVRKAS